MKNIQFTKKQILNEDMGENVLLALGFVPVIGNIANIALIIKYIKEGKNIEAGLMLIALIPGVGDLIAAPLVWLLRGRKAARLVAAGSKNTNLVLGSADDFYRELVANPRAKEIYTRTAKYINNAKIGKTINSIEKLPKFGPQMAEGMRTGIKEHAGILQRILRKPIDISKSIGRELDKGTNSFFKNITGRGPVAMGIKKNFRDERLAKFIAKRGHAPSTWLSHWWHVVYQGSRDRKAYIIKFIMANNMLELFGLPSIESFERKFETDGNFRNQLANNPLFSGLVGDTTTDADLASIESEDGASQKGSSLSPLAQMMTMNVVKNFANKLL